MKIVDKKLISLLAVTMVLLVGCGGQTSAPTDTEETPEETQPVKEEQESGFVPLGEREVQTLSDGTKYVVHPDKIRDGGPPKDGIPSIDDPKFVSVEEADEWIQDNELVLALKYEGVKRVYPLQIMVWHEIVNDEVAGEPLAITYCPLCGSGIAYERTLEGEAVEFGTSGKLYNSNLVMYDRKTDTYWSQISGVAIVGELAGQELTPVSIDTVSWGDWKKEHPDSKVLSRDTGYTKAYGEDPYGNYYEKSNLFFPVENRNDTIHPKDVVYGVRVEGVFKAYTEKAIKEEGTITDTVEGVKLKIKKNRDGTITFTRQDTGEEVPKERDFWFAWYAFHPGTKLYR